ncbi:MAG: enoyl-CoA hydratase [Acidimicrobiales bacterium]
MNDHIRADRRGRVVLLTIDRPERRNAVDHDMLVALAGELEAAAREPGVTRALVLTGAAGHFCAGADLSMVEDAAFLAALRSVLTGLRDAPFPTMAAVEGAALGAGTQLAVACDLRVATAEASFGIPAAKLGVMVDHWTVQRLASLAGHGPARAMLLAAEVLTGAEALRLGLVQRRGDLGDAIAWAGQIADLAPLTVAGHKRSLNRLETDGPAPDDVAESFRRAWSSADLQEGLAAFRERRPPVFRGE